MMTKIKTVLGYACKFCNREYSSDNMREVAKSQHVRGLLNAACATCNTHGSIAPIAVTGINTPREYYIASTDNREVRANA